MIFTPEKCTKLIVQLILSKAWSVTVLVNPKAVAVNKSVQSKLDYVYLEAIWAIAA